MLETVDISKRVKVDSDREVFVDTRVIRVTSIDEAGAAELSSEVSLEQQGGPDYLPVMRDCYRGEKYSLWAMVDSLAKSKIPVVTVVQGKAMSCGVALFTCGKEGYRFVGPHATLMIHDAFNEEGGKGKPSDLKVETREITRLNRDIYAFMERRIKQPKNFLWDQVHARSRSDWYISPKEALALNLANHIKIPELRVKVVVTSELFF